MEIETTGDAFDRGVRIHMRCAWGSRAGLKTIRECLYRYELDVETLVCTRGRPFPIAMLASRLKCPRCGSPRVRVVLDIPPEETRAAASW